MSGKSVIDFKKAEEVLKYILFDDFDDRTYFPTIHKCNICGGVKGIVASQTVEANDKELAVMIALIQQGYYIKMWEGKNVANKEFIPFMCQCIV